MTTEVRFGRPATSEEAFAEGADGTRLFYTITGPTNGKADAPALMLCDGIGCDGYAWKYLVRDFAADHKIVRWHYRGHGRSGIPRDLKKVTFDDLCSDLLAVLKATGTSKCVLVGYSMGVQVVLEFHRRHPELVQGIIVMCGSHGLPLDTFHDSRILRTLIPPMMQAAEKWPQAMGIVWRSMSGGELAYQIATRFEVNGSLVRRDDFLPYFDHLAGMDPRVFLGMLLEAGEHSAYDHLPQIKCPTLIVAGTNDTFTPYWLSEEMHDRIPDSEMCTVPGGTHTSIIEHPELVSLRIEKFLARVQKTLAPAMKAS
ncbi:MAG: alpha/beta hydrolase [Deltaproteobacteria bacterium]|nr:alpha/beta hydrolase [Deltaproteobacteria bacterium]